MTLYTQSTMSQTAQEQALQNELNRVKIREFELKMEQKQLQRYREELQSQEEQENHGSDTDDATDDLEDEQAMENEELEKERKYLAEVANTKREKKHSRMNTKNHKFR